MRCWNCFCIAGTHSICFFSSNHFHRKGERPMRLERRGRRLALGTALLGFACGGKGGGGTGPCTPGAATQLVKNGGGRPPLEVHKPPSPPLVGQGPGAEQC